MQLTPPPPEIVEALKRAYALPDARPRRERRRHRWMLLGVFLLALVVATVVVVLLTQAPAGVPDAPMMDLPPPMAVGL